MTQKDTIFASASPKVEAFNFDEAVADVFPDMINRSVPGYADIIRAAGRIAQRFVTKQSKVYDIGCSLGATSLSISRALPVNHCEITAVDTAQAMVDRCKRIVAQYALPNPIHVLNADANTLPIDNASLVCMNFVLQFIPRENRQPLVNNIATGLNSGGVFMLSEKIQSSSELTNQLLIELHHDYKRDNGYSELEIAQKRAALENVMLTDTLKIHEERLLSAGFSQVTVWYQHYNFVSLLAVK